MQPLDPTLNTVIIELAHRIFPDGFEVSDAAPDSIRRLREHLNAGKRMAVYSGGAEGTIYADAKVNYAFRAWHDWCHWRGGHDFSVAGEKAVFEMQAGQLRETYGNTAQTRWWRRVLSADIVGQRLYYAIHGVYVRDQVAFIQRYLEDPESALCKAM